ncbi:serine/threonine-protein kinase [Dactylosporangium sp. NPDC051484]|uniref:serine/threonine-protein kinase n=1 Tax=Dactylosporangium sp. NPDC051484 TaxID=3154942 RepID=UPI00344C2679
MVVVVAFDGESGARWSYDPDSRIGDDSGFGQVFRGTGPEGEAVAVKLVQLRWDAQSERHRREREVEIDQVLATTAAKHVMRLRDVGRVGNDLLLVMPMADRSLSAAIKASELDEVARIDALRQVAAGLMELAEVPVLHRDLKPANVLYCGGLWRLADFGISRNLLESTGTYTFRGAGTMPYMAPELWDGQPATPKSDLYAFGVLAYEVLTGARPFTGASEAEWRRQHQQVTPGPLSPGVPPALGRLVLRLLAKEPARRPQDARAVVEAIDAAIKRLSPEQEALRTAALAAQQRQASADADKAARISKQVEQGQQITQALADLHEILEEGADLVREALPEVEFQKEGLSWYLAWQGSRVVVEIWTQSPPALDTATSDPLLAAGVVAIAPNATRPLANIVCERGDSRLRWSLLRFTASGLARTYEYGPRDRPHGFNWPVFAAQRGYMLRPMMHV